MDPIVRAARLLDILQESQAQFTQATRGVDSVGRVVQIVQSECDWIVARAREPGVGLYLIVTARVSAGPVVPQCQFSLSCADPEWGAIKEAIRKIEAPGAQA